MKFLAPLFFWSFLAFVPLVAAYLLKVRPRRKDTTAYFLWCKVFTEKRTSTLFQRLRDVLSLLLMSLVFGAVCLALTKPEVQDDERKDLLLMIDNSASMSAGEGGSQRLNLAVTEARNLIKGMDASQRAAVATMAGDIKFLSHITDNPRQLLDALETIEPTALPFRAEALTALRAGDSAQWMKSHRLILITDGCFNGPPPEGVEILKVGAPLENAGIVNADAQFLPGAGNRLGVYVQFASSFKYKVTADLTLKPADSAIIGKLVSVEIDPGINRGETFTIEEGQPGPWLAKLDLKDAFAADNEASLAAQKPKPLRVSVDAGDKFFFDTAVESFSTGSGFFLLTTESPQLVIAKTKTPDAALSLIFQPEGTSPWWKSTGDALESAVPRVVVPEHPVLRHVDAAGMNFAGARRIEPADGALVLVESDERVPLIYLASAGGRSAVVVNMNPVEAEFYYSAWFPVLVHGAASHLAGREEALAASYPPGATIPLPGVGEEETTSITAPNGALMSATGRKFGPLEHPGFYKLNNPAGQWLAAVTMMSPGESLLDNSATTSTAGPISKGWPPYLLLTLLAIVVLIVESFLYHRRKAG